MKISKTTAYWIKDNQYYNIDPGSHIEYIIKNPKLFNLTKNDIEYYFRLYNESLGVEGKAREAILYRLFKNHWIRMRTRGYKITFETSIFKNNSEIISDFLEYLIDNHIVYESDVVKFIIGGKVWKEKVEQIIRLYDYKSRKELIK
ncbi:hypothetical protein LCGC14_1363630 [marine sediment metagenome]|uniref:Uncharacterized protein n=1 Tax=marine sediment metagenome TaxID=412755 RepID=A0A0F9K7W3_9ZZZZ